MWQHEIHCEPEPAAGVEIFEDRFEIGFPLCDGMAKPNVEDAAGERIIGDLVAPRTHGKRRSLVL